MNHARARVARLAGLRGGRPQIAACAVAMMLLGLVLLASAAGASGRLLLRADVPAAMAPLPSGGLVYGELRTGRIFRVDSHGRRSHRPLARVDVSTDGYKGLLGLAVNRNGTVFAAYTTPAPDERLVVARVWPHSTRMIWRGPRAGVEANGGRIAFAPSGRLVLTVGDRLKSLNVTCTARTRRRNSAVLACRPQGSLPPSGRPSPFRSELVKSKLPYLLNLSFNVTGLRKCAVPFWS